MAIILNIETSGEICSVALAQDARIMAVEEIKEANMHSQYLTILIQKAFDKAGISPDRLDAVAVSKGPGSYTGLRIGVSVCKGIAYAKDIPVIAVDTLQAMAWGMQSIYQDATPADNTLFCPMIDARRMEVYACFYDEQLSEIKKVSADIIDEQSYLEFLKSHKCIFGGSGAGKCKDVISHTNAYFIDDFNHSAKYMASLAEQKFLNKDFEDTAYFEPFYLKNFVAQIPTKNVFGKF